MDPDLAFAALFAPFDTAALGRKTFLATLQQDGSDAIPCRSAGHPNPAYGSRRDPSVVDSAVAAGALVLTTDPARAPQTNPA
jgi:hypothetical protein